MDKIIIPQKLARKGELVIIPKKEYEKLLEKQKVTAEDVLRWTHEAKSLLRNGRLPKLNF
ncbi:MAG: hypothetical protein CEN87_17 [Parcubacteria group bacterium Licking1014_1]|nr:MAG: hypothetical protein CEN87_17 [Parcubacteria group bacterium Licking1014_1]